MVPQKRNFESEDEGSLLLAILFAIIVSALIIVATTTVVAGLKKTSTSRDISQCQQAAESSADEAIMEANLGRFNGTTLNASSKNTGVVSYTWSLERVSSYEPNAVLRVDCNGVDVDREFTGSITGLRTEGGYKEGGVIYYTPSPDSSQVVWSVSQSPAANG